MTGIVSSPSTTEVRVRYRELVELVTLVFAHHGVPEDRALQAAEALGYGDLTGLGSHGVTNLTRLYLPLFAEGRVDPGAELEVVADHGAAALVDAHRALGLWAAGEAMQMAVRRATVHGIGATFVRGATHFGCAGYHASVAVRYRMVGIAASNCGRQRIARPPGGRVTMMGTNPLSVAAPAGPHHPFVLDMSTTVVPTGRVRAAARAGGSVPEGWLEDDAGRTITDAGAFDRGEAHLLWLGGRPEAGSYKGYGLGIVVELLAALVAGAGLGPSRDALTGDGRPSGCDDDIGFLLLAVAPGALRPIDRFLQDADEMFGALLECPPVDRDAPVRYPGWIEAERARLRLHDGVPLLEPLYGELCTLARELGLPPPACLGDGA